jgi:quinol monooxygenase YgiN
MTEQVSFIVRLPTRPEQRHAMRSALYGVLEAMAQEPDFINTFVHEDLEAPDTLVLYETWACSKEQFIAQHLSKPYRQQYEASLDQFLSQPRSIEFLKPLSTITPN